VSPSRDFVRNLWKFHPLSWNFRSPLLPSARRPAYDVAAAGATGVDVFLDGVPWMGRGR
jgi:hypothetical protein